MALRWLSSGVRKLNSTFLPLQLISWRFNIEWHVKIFADKRRDAAEGDFKQKRAVIVICERRGCVRKTFVSEINDIGERAFRLLG